MKKSLLLTLICLLTGFSLDAQQLVELAWATTANPTVFNTNDFNVTCGQAPNTFNFRVTYDHCPTINVDCANGCVLSENPYRYTVKLLRNGVQLGSQTFTSSAEAANTFFYNIPATPGIYQASVKFERTSGFLCLGWQTLFNGFTNAIIGNERPPSPAFTGPSDVCIGQSVFVSANTTLNTVSHEWFYYPSNGSPGSSVCNTPTCSFSATTAGSYNIQHRMTTPCGVVSSTQILTVHPEPTVTFDHATFCETETAGDLSYSPAGGIMLGTGVVDVGGVWKFDASAAGPGTHIVYYTFEDENGCTAVDIAFITVDAEITNVTFNHPSNVCESNGNVQLLGIPGGGTWAGTGVFSASGSWYFNPTGLTGQNVLTYSVSSQNDVCFATQQTSIFVDDPVTFSPTIPWPDVCVGDAVTFTASPSNNYSSNLSIDWDYGSNATPSASTNNSVVVTFNQAGTVNVVLEGENECGISSFTYPVTVNAPFTGLQITTPDPICGAVNLTTNYTGPDPVVWSGSGVSPTGQLSNPSSDITATQITASIENACQYSIDSIYIRYREKEITPIQFCTYDSPVTLNADVAPGNWAAVPNGQYPSILPSGALLPGGTFIPNNAGSGEFRVVHQSVCNKAGILKVLPGDPQSTSEWPKHFDDFGSGDESGTDVAKAFDDIYYITGTFSGSMEIDPNEPPLTAVGGEDIFVAKYDDCGVVWARSFGSTGNDHSPAIAWDMGNTEEVIYISGTIAGTTTIPGGCPSCTMTTSASSKGFIAKFDKDGDGVWASIPISSNTELNSFKDISAFGDQVVVTGDFTTSITLNGPTNFATGGPNDQDILVISLLDLGSSPTNFQLLTIGSQNADGGNGIAIDLGSQDIVVTGYATPADLDADYMLQNPGGTDVFLGLVNQSFQWDWINLYGGPNNDAGTGVAAENQIVITGFMEGDVDMGNGLMDQTNNFSVDAFIMNVQKSGASNWHHLGGGAYSLDRGSDVAISQSNVAMIGHFSDVAQMAGMGPIASLGSNDQDIFLATFDLNTGSGINYSSIKGTGLDQGHAIASHPNDLTYLFTGDFENDLDLIQSLMASGSSTDMYAARYDPYLPNIFFKSTAEEAEAEAEEVVLEEVDLVSTIKAFPNPTSALLTIETTQALDAALEVFDMTGKLMERIDRIPAGENKTELDFSDYPAGIYLIRSINTDQTIESIRVIKQ